MAADEEASSVIEKELNPEQGEELLQKLQAKRDEISELGKEVDNLLEHVSREQLKRLAEAMDQVIENVDSKEDAIANISDIPNAATLIELAQQATRSTKELEDIEIQHLPYLYQEVIKTGTKLVAKFDWDAFVERYDNYNKPVNKVEVNDDSWDKGDLRFGLSQLKVLKRVETLAFNENPPEDLIYTELEDYKKSINDLTEIAKQEGLLKDKSKVKEILYYSEEEIQEWSGQLLERLQKGIEQIEDIARLKQNFKHDSFDYMPADNTLDRITSSLKYTKSEDITAGYLSAVENFITKRANQYAEDRIIPRSRDAHNKHIEDLRAKDEKQIIENININGFEIEKDEATIITLQELQQKLEIAVPACFLEKIESITAVPRIDEQSFRFDNENQVPEQYGEITLSYDEKGEATKSTIEIYHPIRVSDPNETILRNTIEIYAYQTIIHEIGHNMHNNLELEDMQAWQEISFKDNTEVTWYVGFARKEMGSTIGLREDFCETYKLAVENPAILFQKSPERFIYINSLMAKYMKEEQYDKFRKNMEEKIETYNENIRAAKAFIQEYERQKANE